MRTLLAKLVLKRYLEVQFILEKDLTVLGKKTRRTILGLTRLNFNFHKRLFLED
jgi:hypothetical protein